MLNRLRQRRRLNAIKARFPLLDIKEPCYIEFEERLFFKGDAYIGPHAFWSAKGGITIGNNCTFGPKTTIWTYNHNINSEELIPYGGEDILKEVVIEDNVWVGLGALILPGVRIGEGAVVGAGAVVTKDIPKCSIVGGNPAVELKKRNIEIYDRLKKENRFYLEAKRLSGRERN